MKPISVAIQGKGLSNFFRRVTHIIGQYGISASKFQRILSHFIQTLDQFGCQATFPIPSAVLQRHAGIIRNYYERGTEFAVHGYYHLDHSKLSQEEQTTYLALSQQVLNQHGIRAQGFRCPYLRWNPATLAALRQKDFSYDSSQGLAWPIPDEVKTPAYQQVLKFYGARSASRYPSLPHLEDGLVRIPYSLPDDEALVDRLALQSPERMIAIWDAILQRTHDLGELFTLGLHPERFFYCQEALVAVLEKSRQLTPKVWIARLDEIDNWWRTRTSAKIEVIDQPGTTLITVSGPKALTVMARAVKVDAPTESWANGYRRVKATSFSIIADQRPFIGISPNAAPKLIDFLRQQGYIVEISDQKHLYTHYLDRTKFDDLDMRPLLSQVEDSERPLVRLGRWPNGAHSALSITGDIDALTLKDYGLRFLGK